MPPEKNINRVYRRSSASTLDSSNYLRGRRTISRYCDDEDDDDWEEYDSEERARSLGAMFSPGWMEEEEEEEEGGILEEVVGAGDY